jgi:four helix bundle protein
MRDFRKLKVWEKGHQLALEMYRETSGFPKDEVYGLTSQIRRAAVSIPANIAEGCGRNGEAELARFMTISMGSASELEYHLLLAHELGIIDSAQHKRHMADVEEVKMMLTSFVGRLKSNGS